MAGQAKAMQRKIEAKRRGASVPAPRNTVRVAVDDAPQGIDAAHDAQESGPPLTMKVCDKPGWRVYCRRGQDFGQPTIDIHGGINPPMAWVLPWDKMSGPDGPPDFTQFKSYETWAWSFEGYFELDKPRNFQPWMMRRVEQSKAYEKVREAERFTLMSLALFGEWKEEDIRGLLVAEVQNYVADSTKWRGSDPACSASLAAVESMLQRGIEPELIRRAVQGSGLAYYMAQIRQYLGRYEAARRNWLKRRYPEGSEPTLRDAAEASGQSYYDFNRQADDARRFYHYNTTQGTGAMDRNFIETQAFRARTR